MYSRAGGQRALWSTGVHQALLEYACGQQALCESVHVVNRHCVRVCMWSTGIVLDCACGQHALC